MNLSNDQLPWRDHGVLTSGNIQSWFAAHLPTDFGRYLPAYISHLRGCRRRCASNRCVPA